MKTNLEMLAALDMVFARLKSNPKTEDEWRAIIRALSAATRYAVKRAFECKRKGA